MGKLQRFRLALAASVVFSVFGVGQVAASQVEPPIKTFDCSDASLCGYSLAVDGSVVGSGLFSIDARGNVSLNGGEGAFFQGEGYFAHIFGVGGNVDPSLLFGGGSANTSAINQNFTFTFTVPLSPPLNAPIKTASQMGITLTPPFSGLAEVKGTAASGFIMEAQDIDVTAGGPDVHVNKGVDLFGAALGPYTATGSGIFGANDTVSFTQSKTGLITTPGSYDFMQVKVAYSLTPGAAVGFSGRVDQVPVPEPSTYMLLAVGLVGVAFAARRRTKA